MCGKNRSVQVFAARLSTAKTVTRRTQSIGVAARARRTAVYASISSLWRWGLRSIAAPYCNLLPVIQPADQVKDVLEHQNICFG